MASVSVFDIQYSSSKGINIWINFKNSIVASVENISAISAINLALKLENSAPLAFEEHYYDYWVKKMLIA